MSQIIISSRRRNDRSAKKDTYSPLEHYNTVGYVMVGISFVAVILLYRVSVLVKKKLGEQKV